MALFEQYSAKRLYGNQTRVDNLIRQYAFTGDRLALPHVECLQGQYYSKRKLWQPQSRIQHDFESSGKKQVLIDTFDNRIDEALQIDPDTAHKTVFFQNIVRVSFSYYVHIVQIQCQRNCSSQLLSIDNSIAKISLYELSRPKFNFGGYMIFELTFKAFRPHDFAFYLLQCINM